MTRISELHEKWLKDDDYAKAYDELETEFELARQMIEARLRAGLTQEELATRMRTSRTVIARAGERPGAPLDADAGASRRGYR